MQQDAVTDVVITLGGWVRAQPAFVLGTNEAGMRLRGATRAADAAIWRRAGLGSYRGGLRRVAPVLAVEVAGDDELEQALREKADWYLGAGVQVVWIVLPELREVLVVTSAGERRWQLGETLPPHTALADLTPQVADFFVQITRQ